MRVSNIIDLVNLSVKQIVKDVKILTTACKMLISIDPSNSSLRTYPQFCPVELADITSQDFHKELSTEDVRTLPCSFRHYVRSSGSSTPLPTSKRSKHIFQSFLSVLVPSKCLLFTLSRRMPALSRVVPNFNVAHLARRFLPFGTISVVQAAVPRETRVYRNLDR